MAVPLDYNCTWEELYHKIRERMPKRSDPKTFPTFKDWFMNTERVGYRFSPKLYGRCHTIFRDMNDMDMDHVTVIIGKVGLGKSTLSVQMAAAIDPNFKLENICFFREDYIERLKQITTGCLTIDEGSSVLNPREAMKGGQVDMIKTFELQRQANNSVIICVPHFRDIDSYIRERRIDTLIRIRAKGKYILYKQKAIRIINEEIGNMPITKIKVPQGTFIKGNFRKEFPKTIKYEDYKSRKDLYWHKHLDNVGKHGSRKHKGDVDAKAIMALRKVCTQQETADKLGISLSSVQKEEAKSKDVNDT